MIAFYPLGENAVLAEFGTSINETVHKKVRAAARILDNHKQQWILNIFRLSRRLLSTMIL